MLLDKDIHAETPGIPDDDRAQKLGITQTNCLKLKVRKTRRGTVVDAEYKNVNCKGRGVGKHLTFCMKEGEEVEGRQLLKQTLREVPFEDIIQEWKEQHNAIKTQKWTEEETIRWTLQNIRIKNSTEEIREQLEAEKGMNFKRIKATLKEMRQNMRNGIEMARNKERASAHDSLKAKTEEMERQVQTHTRTTNTNLMTLRDRIEKGKEDRKKMKGEVDEEKKTVERIDRTLIQTRNELAKVQEKARNEAEKLDTKIDNVFDTVTSEIRHEIRDQLKRQACPGDCDNRIEDILTRHEANRESRKRTPRTTRLPEVEQIGSGEQPTEGDEDNDDNERKNTTSPGREYSICDREENETLAECMMRKVKLYFKGQVEWIPWATLAAFLFVCAVIIIMHCKTKRHNRRLERLEKICKREIQQLRRREREEYEDSGEDSELQEIAPKKGRMLVTTATDLARNREIMIMIIIEINKLLEKTEVSAEEKWGSAWKRMMRVQPEEEQEQERKRR